MNAFAMPLYRTLLSLAAAAALTGCGPDSAAPAEPAPLAGARIGGDFTLTGEDGTPVRWADFAGRYRIVYFGYTYCPDVCPTALQRTAQGWQRFGRTDKAAADRIAVLFITVDPDRDTPAVLKEFTDAFDPRIVGLTGTPEQLTAAAKAFAVFAGKGDTAPGGGYLFDHSDVTYLFGPDGQPITMLPTDKGPAAVAAELAKWVR